MGKEQQTERPVFERYLEDTKTTEDTVPELSELSQKFSEVRASLEQVTFEQVADNLGKKTPFLEGHGYLPIGKITIEAVIYLCEMGSLIAADPRSKEVYPSQEALNEAIRSFYEEATRTLEPSYLINECPVISAIASRAIELLEEYAPFLRESAE